MRELHTLITELSAYPLDPVASMYYSLLIDVSVWGSELIYAMEETRMYLDTL